MMAQREYKIFMLEDDETIQGILKGFIATFMNQQTCECKIYTSSDAVQGLFELTSNGAQYDAIFLDVHMPKLTGDEIYESLSHVNPDLLQKVLFITGFADDVTTRFPDAELNVLHKPFQFNDFAEKLKALLGL